MDVVVFKYFSDMIGKCEKYEDFQKVIFENVFEVMKYFGTMKFMRGQRKDQHKP